MAKIAELLAETGTAEIKTVGASFSITYHSWWEDRFSDEDWNKFRELPAREYMKEVLPRLLVSWDLEDADGNQLPITAEAIEQHHLPTRLLTMMEKAVVDSVAAGKASSAS
jgi:hypothetical protein